jgi:hypothetical protein
VELPTRKFQPISINTTYKQRKRAIERFNELSEEQQLKHGRDHLKDSFTDGEGTKLGFVAEEVIHDHYNENSFGLDIFIHAPTINYDFLEKILRYSHDSKAKSFDPFSEPAGHWNGSVYFKNPDNKPNEKPFWVQKCDVYWFSRVTKDLTRVVIMGFISRYDFFAAQTIDTIGIKGQIEPGAANGFRVRQNCFNIRYDKLWAPPQRDSWAARLILLQDTYGIDHATNRNDLQAERRPQERVEASAVLSASR